MKDFSYITNSSPAYIENMYRDFVENPASVDTELKKFFEGFDFAMTTAAANRQNGTSTILTSGAGGTPSQVGLSDVSWTKEIGIYRLILGYRNKGHLIADTNPIRKRKDRGANLDISFFGYTEADLDKEFEAGKILGLGTTTLRNIVAHLKKIYAGPVGIQYKYISNQEKVDWLTKEFEQLIAVPLSNEKRKHLLEKLNQGVMFEKFLHTKFVGQKRFSLEGGETLIPALDAIINLAADDKVEEVVIGMAHRGRLNVLANTMGKTYEQIFSEFEGTAKLDQTMGSGDVKYHLGFGSKLKSRNNKDVYVKLMPNPSHLEAVDPVVLGFARAKADAIYKSNYDKILPILIHGDASVAGQGIVYECLQMAYLKGYYAGGTIHFVINNQIGFTTDFDDARSSDYCTSLAAAIHAPVFHVNGDYPEMVVKCVEIATRFRQKFNSNIFIDMVCYRKHGHNEGDDPKFTQPHLYALIDKHPNPREVYVKRLLDTGDTTVQVMAKEMEDKFWDDLQKRLDGVKQNPLPYEYQAPEEAWRKLRKVTPADFEASPETSIPRESFDTIFKAMMSWPEGFKPLRKVEKILKDKVKLFDTENKVDWATAELLAFGSLLLEGKDVRMSGQDVQRGTFSTRHAVLRDEETDKAFNRLSTIPGAAGKFRIYNSLLSEYGVLGFEYGYGLANPDTLVLWEAQFGDFADGAQIIIDQFIAAGEQKWNRMNGVTLLLPHGYEGQGPEHSSARVERFLQMSAEYNWIITNITTAANYFHALRRQLAWPFRKPLIEFTPKANLRHRGAFSPVEEFTNGKFQEVIDDEYVDPAKVKKVLFCSGKVYFDLAERQQKDEIKDTAIVRVEQLYPLPVQQLDVLQKKYKKATWFWVQEEPQNMGAASYLQMNLKSINFGTISRQPSASTATGHHRIHQQEQQEIIDTAFSI
ncbi:MAG: 2-oxoglutarate dehydrogenase E1 component [Chitinophagaceae bacterium]|nr:2-oxoglutarate dehydrogenase E1 component [Chitinophagaceae bacterium]HQU55850.1 2-oxoglutarate dehydrogenase E1 component [Chitinophagaceae bacterium]